MEGKRSALHRFRSNTSGTTAIEYALIAFVMSLSLVAGARLIGTNIAARYYAPIAGNLT